MATSATVNKDGKMTGDITYYTYGNGLLAEESKEDGYLTYHFNNVNRYNFTCLQGWNCAIHQEIYFEIGSTTAVTDEEGKKKYIYELNPSFRRKVD